MIKSLIAYFVDRHLLTNLIFIAVLIGGVVSWQNIKKEERKEYQKNAYRVLLTRARQGMVIVVPEGDKNDPTRDPSIYDPTYEYLKNIGFEEIW